MTPEQRQLVIDYQTMFDSEYGQHCYADLMIWSGFNDRIIPIGIDGLVGAVADLGRRDMFLYIKDKLGTRLDKERQETAESEAEDESTD